MTRIRFHFGHLLAMLLLGTVSGGVATYAATKPPPPSAAVCRSQGSLPDPICTPGALNPQVDQSNIQSTICVQGYTKTIRPPVSYTDALKRHQMAQYGYTDALSAHEEDHLIALELGGNPRSPANLWPQPYSPAPGAHEKDRVENAAHTAVCSGRMGLATAQSAIASNWITLGHTLGTL
jgi:hypothetical protein